MLSAQTTANAVRGVQSLQESTFIPMFPSAFSSEEELVKTILHEKCHVLQLKKHGKAYAQQNLDLMEKQAYRFERLFYSLVTKR